MYVVTDIKKEREEEDPPFDVVSRVCVCGSFVNVYDDVAERNIV